MKEVEMPVLRELRPKLARHLFDWKPATMNGENPKTQDEKWDLFLRGLAPHWIQSASRNRVYQPFRPYFRAQVPDDIAALRRPLKEIYMTVELNVQLGRILLALENGVSMESILYELQTSPLTNGRSDGVKPHVVLKSILV